MPQFYLHLDSFILFPSRIVYHYFQLMNAYNKIVNHPVDLGKVCRRIRRRQYENLRDVRVEIWIIFTNCLKLIQVKSLLFQC